MYVSKRNLFFKSKESGYLLFCGNSNSFFQIDDENVPVVKKMFETGDDSDLPEEVKKSFIKAGVILPESDEERFKRLKFLSYQMRFNSNVLTLTIAPTMNCNFKCKYCYEENRIQNVIMSPEVIDGIINFIKMKECKQLNITWYGGEPLCAWSKIVEITNRIEKLCIPQVHYMMVTNGSLINDDVVKFFAEKKFEAIQITLDGDEKTHNERRPMKNNGNSFKSIFSSLDRIYDYFKNKNMRINFSIRVNMDNTNKNEYQIINEKIQSKYGHFFNVYPGLVFRNSTTDICSTDCMSSLQASENILKMAKNNDLSPSMIYPLRNRLLACGSQSVNNFVIDPLGDIYKCWEEILQKENALGNVITGFRDEKNLLQSLVMENTGFEDDNCKDCLFLYSCMGGCPKQRMENKLLQKELNPVCVRIKNNPKGYLETYYNYKLKNN